MRKLRSLSGLGSPGTPLLPVTFDLGSQFEPLWSVFLWSKPKLPATALPMLLAEASCQKNLVKLVGIKNCDYNSYEVLGL
jgi:hypothetical protein